MTLGKVYDNPVRRLSSPELRSPQSIAVARPKRQQLQAIQDHPVPESVERELLLDFPPPLTPYNSFC
ncbi:hypothetical protein [Nostoc sp.]|uniref:hypothetical protein n=1 Tax=Nostoc sp. TaxID=1180 RepID=UPI002FF8CBB0